MKYEVEINQRAGKRVSEKWVVKIVRCALRAGGIKNAEISIAFVGNREIKKINKKWRGKNCVTDVLSFVYQMQNTKNKIPLNGEIIICYPQALRQAKEGGRRAREEIKILLIHGLLHLCGYEHERSLKEAEKMRKMEKIILEKIKDKI